MTMGLLFWILMILWLISIVGARLGTISGPLLYVGDVLIFILLALLGWHVFGPAIHG